MSPLTGVIVIDATEYVSGPFAGVMLAGLGADVVRVERAGKGESFRSFGLRHHGVSAFCLNVNRGKRTMSLDLKTESGRAALLDVLESADVFLQNCRPGVAEEPGLDSGTIERHKPAADPRLDLWIRAHGPAHDLPAFDALLLQAESGFAVAEGDERGPTMVNSAIIDKITAAIAAQAAIAALLPAHEHRHRSTRRVVDDGRGGDWKFPDMFQDTTFLDSAERSERNPAKPLIPTSDGYIVCSPVSGAQMKATCIAIGQPELVFELKEIRDPAQLMATLFARVANAVSTQSTAGCASTAARARCPVGCSPLAATST